MTQRYDRFMVAVGVGTNRKLRRLPVVQRWAYVAGVLSLAAQSPMRGALLITDGEHVTPEDIAAEASVPVKDARAALTALRRLGMVQRDAHGIEWVHDWDSFNPDPKPSDSPEATRERKRQQRERERLARDNSKGHAPTDARDIGVTSHPFHAPKLSKGKDLTPPTPQAGNGESGRVDGEITSREEARTIACPRCGASPNASCIGADGAERQQLHAERHTAAIAVGAPVLTFGGRKVRPRSSRPGPREAGTNPRAQGTNPRTRAEQAFIRWATDEFPGVHVNKVRALMDHLRSKKVEPTTEAMRAYAAAHPVWALEPEGTAA